MHSSEIIGATIEAAAVCILDKYNDYFNFPGGLSKTVPLTISKRRLSGYYPFLSDPTGGGRPSEWANCFAWSFISAVGRLFPVTRKLLRLRMEKLPGVVVISSSS